MHRTEAARVHVDQYVGSGFLVAEGSQTTLHVRAEDQALWRRAQTYARERRIPMAGLVMLALQEYLTRHDTDE
ncbi:hypothetical protein ABNF93_10350 [Actinopolymorpha sp. B9G3]